MTQVHSGSSPGLPLLVIIINAFLHIQSSSLLQSSVNFSHHLNAFIAHFASLGPVARLYLLKTRTFARQLKLLLTYNNSANLPQPQVDEAETMYEKVPLIEVMRDDSEHGGGYLTPNMMVGNEQKLSFKERSAIL